MEILTERVERERMMIRNVMREEDGEDGGKKIPIRFTRSVRKTR